MATIRLREAVPGDIEPMARVGASAFKDDILFSMFWLPSLRIGREEAALETMVGAYMDTTVEAMEGGRKFIVAVEGDEIVGWAEWVFATFTESDNNVTNNDDDGLHMAGVNGTNEPEYTESSPGFVDLAAHKEIESTIKKLEKQVCSGLDKNDTVLLLEEISVAPEHQRRHIGKRLLEWGLQRARMADCRAFVMSLDHNLGFYKRAGFNKVDSTLIRDVRINALVAS